MKTLLSSVPSLFLFAVACGPAPVTNVTIEIDDAGRFAEPIPAPAAPDAAVPPPTTTVLVKVEYPDASAPTETATPDAAVAIVCPDPSTCGTVLGPTALTCLAQIDICYAMRSTSDPIDDTDNRYDACLDLCQATLLQCQSTLVNPDGTVIGTGEGGVEQVENETNAYDACGGAYNLCCNGCLA
jgi:hypothetical protein